MAGLCEGELAIAIGVPGVGILKYHWYDANVEGEAVRIKDGSPAHEFNGPNGEMIGADGLGCIKIGNVFEVLKQPVVMSVIVTVYRPEWLASERFWIAVLGEGPKFHEMVYPIEGTAVRFMELPSQNVVDEPEGVFIDTGIYGWIVTVTGAEKLEQNVPNVEVAFTR